MPGRQSKPKERDTREYDVTQLKAGSKGRLLARDYSAHFFRWSFARRFMDLTKSVLDVGCGQEKPLLDILRSGPTQLMRHYVGVDLNPLRQSVSQNVTLFGEFNFVERWQELNQHPEAPFDVIVSFEVIEHMHQRHGVEFLRGIRNLLHPEGTALISTPCFDGRRHAANHIHEYTTDELMRLIDRSGLVVVRRHGTFMDVNAMKRLRAGREQASAYSVRLAADTWELLKDYFDDSALSCFFAPLFPDQSRNNLWVLKRRA